MDRPAVDRRGVSTAVGYVLTLSVTTVLISGLLVGVGSFVEDQRAGTTREELQVIGQQVAGDLSSADRLARVGSPSEVRIQRGLPESVTGAGYRIEVTDGATPDDPVSVELSTENPDVTVSLGVHLDTPVVDATLQGGGLVVRLNASGELEVTRA